MPESSDHLQRALLDLGESGCQGNSQDYRVWVELFHNLKASPAEVESALASLERAGRMRRHADFPNEYLLTDVPRFETSVEYQVSGMLEHAPIQMVRSRLESFLRYHATHESDIIDISIATTEAMENAVKYSDHKEITVSYGISNSTFSIRIVNRIGETELESDIEQGKYTGSITLMRGMMVMVKLFDDVDIDISEDEGLAIFKATTELKA